MEDLTEGMVGNFEMPDEIEKSEIIKIIGVGGAASAISGCGAGSSAPFSAVEGSPIWSVGCLFSSSAALILDLRRQRPAVRTRQRH